VDTSVVTCAPGLGDDVQAIKAGILEIADVLLVTKGDMPLAERTARDLRDMLRLRSGSARQVPVLTTAAAQGVGIDALVDAIVAHGVRHGRGRRLRTAASPSSGVAEDIRARVARLYAADPFVEHCAIELVEAGEGHATLRMTVQRTHLNFSGTCHGGALFALADSVFGLASNSHGVRAAGIDAHIAYHVAARDGDVLVARAAEVSRGKKIATYRVDVERADGTRIASFTGTVFRSEASGAS
jgi:acyl-CoA thioesterase